PGELRPLSREQHRDGVRWRFAHEKSGGYAGRHSASAAHTRSPTWRLDPTSTHQVTAIPQLAVEVWGFGGQNGRYAGLSGCQTPPFSVQRSAMSRGWLSNVDAKSPNKADGFTGLLG